MENRAEWGLLMGCSSTLQSRTCCLYYSSRAPCRSAGCGCMCSLQAVLASHRMGVRSACACCWACTDNRSGSAGACALQFQHTHKAHYSSTPVMLICKATDWWPVWYVRPGVPCMASALVVPATRTPAVIFHNVSAPGPKTRPWLSDYVCTGLMRCARLLL